MEKSRSKAGAPAARTAAATGPWDAYRVSWIVTFAGLSLLLLVFVTGPLLRIGVHYSLGYNEGNAAYFTRQTMTGPPVYAAPPKYVFTDYPPLSYHLVGNLAKLTGDYTATGRWVAVFAYLVIGILAGLIVRELGGSTRSGAYAALCWWIWLAAFDPARVGYNDPHLLAIAFGMAGVYCFVRDRENTRWLVASAVLFSLSLFTKHSLIAFPAAIAIDLFLSSRRHLAIWLGTAVAVCLVLLGLTLAIDGRYFFSHLMFPRTFSFAPFSAMITIYAGMFQVAFAGALLWAFRHPPGGRDRFLIWALFLGHAIGAGIVFGSGAGINHFYDALLALVLIAGVGLPMLLPLAEGTRFPRASLTILLLVPLYLGVALNIPRRLDEAAAAEAKRPQREHEFAAVAEFIKAQPGPALCEELMYCYEAGKPKVFDAFNVQELVKAGQLPESTLFQMLESHYFGAIELDWTVGERRPRYSRFSDAFISKLFATYKPAIQTSAALIFTPR